MGKKNYSKGYGNSQPGDSSAFMVVIVVILVMAAGCYFGFIAN